MTGEFLTTDYADGTDGIKAEVNHGTQEGGRGRDFEPLMGAKGR
jgi:hypothetical protein